MIDRRIFNVLKGVKPRSLRNRVYSTVIAIRYMFRRISELASNYPYRFGYDISRLNTSRRSYMYQHFHNSEVSMQFCDNVLLRKLNWLKEVAYSVYCMVISRSLIKKFRIML